MSLLLVQCLDPLFLLNFVLVFRRENLDFMTANDQGLGRAIAVRYVALVLGGTVLNLLVLRDWLGLSNGVRFPIAMFVSVIGAYFVVPGLLRAKGFGFLSMLAIAVSAAGLSYLLALLF